MTLVLEDRPLAILRMLALVGLLLLALTALVLSLRIWPLWHGPDSPFSLVVPSAPSALVVRSLGHFSRNIVLVDN
jgi:hypothetical protein